MVASSDFARTLFLALFISGLAAAFGIFEMLWLVSAVEYLRPSIYR
jgi:hypothetical protein